MWKDLPKPIFALAPMEEVTDVVFREMFARYGKPSVMFTEFVSVDGLMHDEGRKRLKIDLEYTEIQRPMVAQIWGTDPEKFTRVAEWLVTLGFDAIDINMGCPQSKEIQSGACAALIRTPKLAQEIVKATKKGAGKLDVSVKTRLGYSKTSEMEDWLKYLLETEPAAITLHARTKQEMSKVPAHWEKITEAVEIRNREKSDTLILGNGDIKSKQEGLQRIAETGCDGVMVGRGVFGNPWWFAFGGENLTLDPGYFSDEALKNSGMTPSVEERLRVMVEHAELFEQKLGGIKSFALMRKHFKAYASGFDGAAELRAQLMETKNTEETKKIVDAFLKTSKNS